jgi:hypothetical protein
MTIYRSFVMLCLAGCGKLRMHAKTSLICTSETGGYYAGCSKRPSSEAAASEEARRTLRYVEPLSDARTMHGKIRILARRGRPGEKSGLFSILLELFGSSIGRVAVMLLCATLLLWIPPVASAKSKPHRAPRPEPELKIFDLKVSPNPYTISSGPLEFSALVRLPKELDGATLLELSSFITSPSKNSLRFLTTRTALEPHEASTNGAPPPQVTVLLTWDGLDQKKIASVAGLYQYEVRAKLLTNGEKGPRTQMVAWPKRGTIEVK